MRHLKITNYSRNKNEYFTIYEFKIDRKKKVL